MATWSRRSRAVANQALSLFSVQHWKAGSGLGTRLVENHVFLTIFTVNTWIVQGVVARSEHCTLLCPGSYYSCTTKCPHWRGNETPVVLTWPTDVGQTCITSIESSVSRNFLKGGAMDSRSTSASKRPHRLESPLSAACFVYPVTGLDIIQCGEKGRSCPVTFVWGGLKSYRHYSGCKQTISTTVESAAISTLKH